MVRRRLGSGSQLVLTYGRQGDRSTTQRQPNSFRSILPDHRSGDDALLPSTRFSPRTLLGAGGTDRETTGQLYASQIANAITTKSPEESRSLMLGLGLPKWRWTESVLQVMILCYPFFEILSLGAKGSLQSQLASIKQGDWHARSGAQSQCFCAYGDQQSPPQKH